MNGTIHMCQIHAYHVCSSYLNGLSHLSTHLFGRMSFCNIVSPSILLNTLKSTTYHPPYTMPLLEPTPPSADILTLPQEDRIQLAIDTIANAGLKPNSDQKLSMCKAADTYDIPCTTLRSRMKGLRTRAEAHVEQQALSPAEEEVLIKWANVQGRRGIPLTYCTLTKYASEISGKLIGESWPKCFLARHADLKVKVTTSLEKCWAKALNQTAVEEDEAPPIVHP